MTVIIILIAVITFIFTVNYKASSDCCTSKMQQKDIDRIAITMYIFIVALSITTCVVYFNREKDLNNAFNNGIQQGIEAYQNGTIHCTTIEKDSTITSVTYSLY